MGNCQLFSDDCDSTSPLNPSQFDFACIIGGGGYGRVWRAAYKPTGEALAIKEMKKDWVAQMGCVDAVMRERQLLAVVHHPFVVNMKFAFQDEESLYLAMDFMPGGDLGRHMERTGAVTEAGTRFYAACIIAGLEYLHLNRILHRDIKPENLLMDEKGYLKISDFGAAIMIGIENQRASSGTPGYIAPEVLLKSIPSPAVDYFSLGVILYECINGFRLHRSSVSISGGIISQPLQFRKKEVPVGWSVASVDFVNKLLERNPRQRLGANGPKEVKNHAWFAGFDWQKLMEKKMRAPFLPKNNENIDKSEILAWRNSEVMIGYESREEKKKLVGMFSDYFYDYRQKKDPNQTEISGISAVGPCNSTLRAVVS